MRPFMEQPAKRSVEIFLPYALDMDESPLTLAIREVLDTRKRQKIIFPVSSTSTNEMSRGFAYYMRAGISSYT